VKTPSQVIKPENAFLHAGLWCSRFSLPGLLFRVAPLCLLIVVGPLLPETRALDLNGDGMSDVWQSLYSIGPTEGLDDPDGDGEDNFREAYWGTDPGNPGANSRLYISTVASTNLDLSWLGVDQKEYQLESSAGLSAWSNLLGVIGGGGTSSVMVVGGGGIGFFRNRILPDSDSDGDGLLDWEEGLLGSDPTGLDGDGDGIPDTYEFLKGTDAADAMSSPGAAWYVSTSVLPGGDGSSGNPFDTIQAALDAAVDYDIIELADGTYVGIGNRNLSYGGKDVLLHSTNGAQNCIIDCEENTGGIIFNNGETGLAILSGVTIRNGSSGFGAGLRCLSSSSPTIWNCVIEKCQRGGGVQITTSSSPLFDGCLIRDNQANNDGGGMTIGTSSAPVFRNCRILNNMASDDGGGIYIWNSAAAPTFLYCVIAGNVCGDDGGALYDTSSSLTLLNCTVANNQAGPTTGGGLYNSSSSVQPLIHNSILWGNTPNEIQGGQPTVTYSDVQGGFAGTGNIDANPMLTVAYRLTAASTCIDAGSSSNAPPVDPDGESHVDNPSHPNVVSIVDMGADEFVDSDADGLADAWEVEFLGDLSQGAGADGDLDTLTNLEEYELTTDPDEADTDGDGLEDGEEIDVYGTSPLNADSDEDVMTDGEEVTYGLDPLDASDQMEDPDGDRIPNLYEIVHGSNPTNNLSVPAPTLHVDASALPGGDGSAGMPFDTIQPALDAAGDAHDIVQVADGVYTGAANRNLDFNGKALILHSANGAENCVIDCQLSGRGVLFFDGEDQRTLLQGLTIRNGSNSSGGGLAILTDCSPLIRDCRIENCVATSSGGAGVLCTNSEPTFERCTISDNTANGNGDGGGVTISSNARPIFRFCRIVRNQAGDDGGGVMISASSASPEFYSCVIANNETGDDGGGLYNNLAAPLLINCTVAGNRTSSSTGGGLFSNGGAPVVQNCVAWANVPDQIVGGTPVISYSVVQGGAAGTGNITEDPLVTPITFRLTASSPCIDAGTDTNTPPADIDGELRVDDPAHSNAVSIVDIGADEFVDIDADLLADVWELEHFGDLSPTAGGDADFDDLDELGEYESSGDPNDSDTDGDGLSDGDEVLVHSTSPTVADTDEDETPDGWEIMHGFDPLDPTDRIDDADADRIPNVYEFVHGSDPTNAASTPVATLYVDAAAPPGGNGTVGNPFDTIQEGLTAAMEYDIVQVADGIYTGSGNFDLDFDGTALLLISESGASNCVIDCELNGRGFSFENGEDDRSVLDGFTVRNGSDAVGGGVNCDASDPTLRGCILQANHATSSHSSTGGGGGIRCVNADPLIQECTIISNTAAGSGAGIFLISSSSPRIEDCLIAENSCSNITFGGGGILMSTGNPVLRDCTISNNTAQGDGGGIYRLNTSSVVEGCLITGNASDDSGGGIYSQSSPGTIRGCRIVSNDSQEGGGVYMLNSSDTIENSALAENTVENGGGLFLQNSDPQILHCTFWLNNASGGGGGIWNDVNSNPTIHNSIVWSNAPDALNPSGGSPQVSYSDIEGGSAGAGNLDANPLLTRHYRLRSASPCIDAGSDTNALPQDIDGEARWDHPPHTNIVSIVDMGWDEFVDSDADALADIWEVENFGDLAHSSAEDADTQGGPDGLTNLEEYEQNTDPNNADTDGDTLTDGNEVDVVRTDPLNKNTDGDNLDDDQEVAIGSDPLDPLDIKITGLSVGPLFLDPVTNLGEVAFSVNWTCDVSVAVYPVTINVNSLGPISYTFGTTPARTISQNVPPGAHVIEWDGRDDSNDFVNAGMYMVSASATNIQGLTSMTNYPTLPYIDGPVTVSNLFIGTNFNFVANEPLDVHYTLAAPAVVVVSVLSEAFPIAWGEARDVGPHIEYWDGRGGGPVQGEGELYEGDFNISILAKLMPEMVMNVGYLPDLITDVEVETYLIIPNYAQVSAVRYAISRDANVDIGIQDPDGNLITLLDPVFRTAGAHDEEWLGEYTSNVLVAVEGDYRVLVTAEDAGSGAVTEASRNISIRHQ